MKGDVRQANSNAIKSNLRGVFRVWVKDKDFPGLAMSRSIGDKIAHTVGVIPDPDVTIYKMNKEEYTYFVVSASDGIWDALEFAKVKNFLSENKQEHDLNSLCRTLCEKARCEWLGVR
jgi:serine/threonine protein phosphatase PrpC